MTIEQTFGDARHFLQNGVEKIERSLEKPRILLDRLAQNLDWIKSIPSRALKTSLVLAAVYMVATMPNYAVAAGNFNSAGQTGENLKNPTALVSNSNVHADGLSHDIAAGAAPNPPDKLGPGPLKLTPDLSFLSLSNKFTDVEKVDITTGINDAATFWHSKGMDTTAFSSADLLLVQNAKVNSAFFDNGVVRLNLIDHQKGPAAHETAHELLGFTVQGMPAWPEGFAVMTQELLYGGSAVSDQSASAKSLGNFTCAGGPAFDPGENGVNMNNGIWRVENYNRAAEAAKALGIPFWVHISNRLAQWRLENNLPLMAKVPADIFKGFVNDFKPGLFDKITKDFPVLGCN